MIGRALRAPLQQCRFPARLAGVRFNSNAAQTTPLKDANDVTATYRDVMGLHSQPVMILTTNGNSEGHEPRGLTLSSVTSLSLKPEPLVCFNLQVPSRTSQVLHDREVFALNMLPGTKDSVRACRFFSGAYGNDVNPFAAELDIFTKSQDFHNLPVILDSMAILYCQKHQVMRVHDHEIWVAKVVGVDNRSLVHGADEAMLYQKRHFKQVGKEIGEPTKEEVAEDVRRGTCT